MIRERTSQTNKALTSQSNKALTTQANKAPRHGQEATTTLCRYSQALNRVKKPLYSLSKHSDPEIALVGLCHVCLLVQQAPYAFSDDFQQFFCRHSDPAYVKLKKIDVLKYLATEGNQIVLVGELMEYTKVCCVFVGERFTGTSRQRVCALPGCCF